MTRTEIRIHILVSSKVIWRTLYCTKSICIGFCTNITASWGPRNHARLTPGVRPLFLDPKLHKEMDFGVKPINYRPPICDFFQKIVKKIERFVDFQILSSKRPVLKNLIAGHLESIEILQKCWKLFNFFNMWFFIFENQVFEVQKSLLYL